MSVFSQFGIYGYAPIGASVLSLDAPVNYTSGAAEYLRTGNIKTYSSAYAPSVSVAPQLRVFGTPATTYAMITGSYAHYYYKVGTKYVSISPTGIYYGTALSSISTLCTGNDVTSDIPAAVGGGYMVVALDPATSSTYRPKYSVDGITFTAVAGTGWSISTPRVTAMCFGNNSWLSLSSLSATTGERAYIGAADPSGTWTLGASTNLGMTSVKGVAYGAGVFVAVGSSSAATTGKIATATTADGAWTDRTTASGISFASTASVSSVVFDGTAFVGITNTGNIVTSTTGTGTWVERGAPMDLSGISPLAGSASWPGGGLTTHINTLSTDGAGTVVYQPSCSSATIRPMFAYSTDHGITWTSAQTFIGTAAAGTGRRTMSFVDNSWVSNVSCDRQSLVNIGAGFSTPNYVGIQADLGAGQFVRIK